MIAYCDLSTHRVVGAIAICALAAFFLPGAVGCGPDDAVLAKIGEVEITESELDRFGKRLPVHLRSQKQGVEAEREYLHSMIDQEMLLLEARVRGLDSSASVLLELEDVERQHLSERYAQEVIAAKIEIGPEDVERAFHDMGFDRERLLSRIIIPGSEEQARDVVAQLEAGKDFGELAREYAGNDAIADENGRIGWMGMPGLKRLLIPQQDFFSLAVKEVGFVQPVAGVWQIFRFEEDRPAKIESYREDVLRLLQAEEWWRRREEEVELLNRTYGTRYHPEAVQVLIERVERQGALSEEEGRQSFYTFADGREMTTADYLRRVRELGGNTVVRDSTRLVGMAEKALLHPQLFSWAARDRGWHREADFLAWKAHTYDGILLKHLMQGEVEDHLSFSASDIRSFYDANPERFRATEQAKIEEVHVKDEMRARQFRAEIEGGTTFAELLRRPGVASNGIHRRGGKMVLQPHHTGIFPELAEAALNAREGDLIGPIYLGGPDAYGLLRVLERKESRVLPFEEAEKQVENIMRTRRREERIVSLFQAVKRKYADRIVLYEDRLEQRNRDL